MRKLKYSLSAYLRLMQISNTQLFIFAEGIDDRYIYIKLAEAECRNNRIIMEIKVAKELPIKEGKRALLKFFDFLKAKSSLINDFKGKITISIFFLDKDLDDFLRIKRHSKHIIYTKTYELENYLFLYGNLAEAISASISADPNLVNEIIGNEQEWRLRAATNWKNWVKLCIYSHSRKINSDCRYSFALSKVNGGAYMGVDRDKYNRYLSEIEALSNLSHEKFLNSYKRLSKKVDKLYSEGQHDLIFKGKWYIPFLVDDINKIKERCHINQTGLVPKIYSCLRLTLNFDDNWAEHFRTPIRNLLNETGLS